jgi:hypothetical protein
MTVFYADLSHHDWDRAKGELGWSAIRAATSPVVVIRATYGDPGGWNRPTYHFADMAAGARAAGFSVIGGYHNLVSGDAASMRRQVDWLRRELDAVGGSWAMADVERYPELMTAGMYPRWSDVLRWQDAWYAADDRVMAWYLPKWVWSRADMGSPDLSKLHGPLVASRYPTTTDGTPAAVYAAAGGDTGPGWAAYGGKAPAIWQFSSTVNVSGASGDTDVNAYRGTLAELTALLTGDDMALTDADVDKVADAVWGRWLGASGPTTAVALQSTYQAVKQLAGEVPADLVARLDAILAAAKDDGDLSVVLPPDAVQALADIKAAIAGVPSAAASELAKRLVS